MSNSNPESVFRATKNGVLRSAFGLLALMMAGNVGAATESQHNPVANELSSHAGHEVVVFWASWCSRCKSVLRDLNELSGSEEAQGVRFTAANLDHTVSHTGKPRPLNASGLATADNAEAMAEQMGVRGLPWVVVLDAKGNPVYTPSASVPPAQIAEFVKLELVMRK